MKNTIKGIIIGIIISTVLLSSVFAASNSVTISAVLNNIAISINGENKAKPGEMYTLASGIQVPYSINYQGTTYLPLRKVAELLGKNVEYIAGSNTASITDVAGFEKICPIVYNYEITYDVNGSPSIDTYLTNISNKTISGAEFFFYMLDNDFKPIIDSNGRNIFDGVFGEEDSIEPGETVNYEWLADEFKGTVYIGFEVINVEFSDGTMWHENQ